MRTLLKRLAHGTVRILEHIQVFYIPSELPLKTKLSFLFGRYEIETSKYIRKNVRGGVAFDIGAHIGYYSRLLAPLVDTVYAFEPEPRNFALLVKNTKKYRNIVPVNAAVSDIVGRQDFFIVKNSTFRHSLINEGDCESVTVDTTTLDAFVNKKGIRNVSFAKIDVEGHEKDVLVGMKEVIKNCHPLVIAEMPMNDTYTPVSAVIGRQGILRNYIIV
ncbi:TPA: hypothetical protein DIV48_01180 [Candidatus Kaiserbacteria bacterium]|nr:MAG: methyltransferase [Parcubacteria group bacterium GW2011_GWA1_56_13]KKW46317.1 MAG: methyltransferase [Parcubacteria group bacterium GW2011_GWB1_57_6]HCR52244.1 hypothetical protein [Candidatus Kaiserbacteria bacterium]